MDRRAARAHIADVAQGLEAKGDQDQFAEIAEAELLALHDGNFARYQIRPSEFAAWKAVWV